MQNSLQFPLLPVPFFPTDCVHRVSSSLISDCQKEIKGTAKPNLKATRMWRIFHCLFDSMPSIPCDPAGQPESCILAFAWQQGTRTLIPTQIRCLRFLPSYANLNMFFPVVWTLKFSVLCFFPFSQEHKNWLLTTENGHSKQNRNDVLAWQDAVAEMKG